MLEKLTLSLQTIINIFQQHFWFTSKLLIGLWVINTINWAIGYRLNVLGIYPRTLHGMPGIFFSPFLHGNFNHLFFNSIPLFVLANFVLIGGIHQFAMVTLIIVVISGILIWLLSRPGFHIGASTLVMGYWSYILMNSYQQPSELTIILGIITIYYFGSLLFSLFPTREKVSWEGHLSGFLAGIIASYFYPLII